MPLAHVVAHRHPETTPRRVLYSGSLLRLIAIALHRPSFESLRAGIALPSAIPVDESYLAKVLDEESTRQFAHPLRPILEIVLNAVDALGSTPGAVDIRASDGRAVIEDFGEGMKLDTILSRLLVPFATTKSGPNAIGRFGVGFFSTLGLGRAAPDSFALELETGTSEEGWLLRFQTTGSQIDEILIELEASVPRAGTRVVIQSTLLQSDALSAYLMEALHFFDAGRVTLRLNGEPLNSSAVVRGGAYGESTYDGVHAGRLRYQIGGTSIRPGIVSGTFHRGVRTDSCAALTQLALVDLPSSVEMTMSRDTLKCGPAFEHAIRAFFNAIETLPKDVFTTDEVADMAGQLSALLFDHAAWTESAPHLRDTLLNDRYLIRSDRREALLGFLGPTDWKAFFVPESIWSAHEWLRFLPGEEALLERSLTIHGSCTLLELAEERPDLGSVPYLMARAPDAARVVVTLASSTHPAGPLPCLEVQGSVLLRVDSPCVMRPRSWQDIYAIRIAFDRAFGFREADTERRLIVLEPLCSA